MKNRGWIFFAAVGVLFLGWGIHQVFIIPTYTDHWDWLVPTPDLIEYIHFRFQQLGTITLANGLFILGIALTGFRKQEHWAWGVLTVVPVYFLLLTVVFPWLFFLTIPPGLLAGWALWANKLPFQSARKSDSGPGWMIVFAVGLLLLYFAYDNLFVIPALEARDPARGWAWLTTNPEHIDYIKFYFRVYGIHIAAFAGMTLLTTFVGLRQGNRPAWQVLWLLPLLVSAHVFLWPWLAPLLVAIALLAGLGLGLARRQLKE